MKKKIKFNYRHIICLAITLLFAFISIFFFTHAYGRIAESIVDLGNSIAYYFSQMFMLDSNVAPTINNMTGQPFTLPFNLPQTWEEFQIKWGQYWSQWASSEMFNSYLLFLSDILYVLAQIILILIPIILLAFFMIEKYLSKENNDYNKDSKGLIYFKLFVKKAITPIKKWINNFKSFLQNNKVYKIVWALIWLHNFNFTSIVISFIAYYFYFIISFDLASIYTQIYKLFTDLSVILNTIPLVVWLVFAYLIICKIRKKIAYKKLNNYEMRNRGFINSRPIVLMTCGTMGKKKTTTITDMALSQDIMFRDKAFEKILQNDLKFPNFPWINLEIFLKGCLETHAIYNLATIKKLILRIQTYYEKNQKQPHKQKYMRKLKYLYHYNYTNFIFDYDVEKYGCFYDDNLKTTSIWEVILTYSQLYFIYVIQSSLLITNYSIRTDNVLEDLGNFPIWNNDFFKKDTRLMESFTRHSHILDFDTLRLGKKVIEENKNADSFEFGVIVITEIGKERGNNLELLEKKKKDEIANQKNDLFNYWLKMIRHSATVDNFPFVKVITDDQRPSSWGADARELCDIIHITNSGEQLLAMPFFFVEELLYQWLFNKFSNMYYKYRYVRADNTLPMYLLKNLVAKLNHYYNKIYNNFGFTEITVQVENGVQDGNFETHSYYLMNKKIYSKRFSTDCISDLFMQKALRSPIGINDLIEFKTEKATLEELLYENSYFMNDIISGFNKDKNDKK